MNMNLSKLREMVMDKEAWHAVIHGVAKSRTRLSDWTELNVWALIRCPSVWGVLHESSYNLVEWDVDSPHFTEEEGMRREFKKLAQGQEQPEGRAQVQVELEPDSAPGFKL